MKDGNVDIGGVWGTFDAGLEWVSEGDHLPSSAASNAQSEEALEESDEFAWDASVARSSPIAIGGRKRSGSQDSRASSLPGQSFPTPHYALPPSPPQSPEVRPTSRTDQPPADGLSRTSSVDFAHSTEAETADVDVPTHFLFLGSSLGNFNRPDAAEFLRSLPLREGSGDCLVLGLDGRNEQEIVEKAYNDPQGITREWAENLWNVSTRSIEHLVL